MPEDTASVSPKKNGGPLPKEMVQRRSPPWPLAIVALIFIIVPFLYWYGTWFGRSLTDPEIGEYLQDHNNPRHIQHALSQLAEKMASGDKSVKKWYPQIVALRGNSLPEIRLMAAWTMGQDREEKEFHSALKPMLNDPEPIVKQNAALALARFGEPEARPHLREMLRKFTIHAPLDGVLQEPLPVGVTLKKNFALARIRTEAGALEDVRTPLAGRIHELTASENTHVRKGDAIFILSPDEAALWEALRALYLIGEGEEDLAAVRGLLNEGNLPERIRKQAEESASAIEKRSAAKSN